jgi:hypothetical protein
MAASTITVFTGAEVLAAATATEQAGKPFFTVSKKGGKDADKKYKGGTTFLNVKFHGFKTKEGKDIPKAEGWVGLTDIPIQALPDPKKRKPGTEDIKPQISATVSSLGDFGKALMIAQKQWRPAIQALEEAKAIPKKKIHDLVQLTISENAEEKAGEPLDDPIFRGKIADYGEKFPDTYPIAILAGKPKTEILDYRTGRKVDGKAVYDPATVLDDNGKQVPVDFTNIHKFITKGSILRYGRLIMNSVAVSQNWTSMQFHFTRLIIEPGKPTEFSDDSDSLPVPDTPIKTNVDAPSSLNDNNAKVEAASSEAIADAIKELIV